MGALMSKMDKTSLHHFIIKSRGDKAKLSTFIASLEEAGKQEILDAQTAVMKIQAHASLSEQAFRHGMVSGSERNGDGLLPEKRIGMRLLDEVVSNTSPQLLLEAFANMSSTQFEQIETVARVAPEHLGWVLFEWVQDGKWRVVMTLPRKAALALRRK